MRKILILTIGLIVFGFSTGTVYALITHEDNVQINGKLTVKNGGFVFERTDNVQTAMQLINDKKQTTFSFIDPDDDRNYVLRVSPGPSPRLDFLDSSGDPPVSRVDMSIKATNGKIGMGTTTPDEKLELIGNFKLSGNILSDSNLEIKPNGDLCLGSGC